MVPEKARTGRNLPLSQMSMVRAVQPTSVCATRAHTPAPCIASTSAVMPPMAIAEVSIMARLRKSISTIICRLCTPQMALIISDRDMARIIGVRASAW